MSRIVMVAPAKPFNIHDPSRHSVNLEYYVRILLAAGHDSAFYGPPESVCSPDIPVHPVRPEEYTDVSFWRRQKIDAAIMITSLKRAHLLQPLKDAGIRVINRADSSGDISIRVFPAAWWRYLMAGGRTPFENLRAAKNWLDSSLRLYKEQDLPRIASIEASDRVAIETETGRENLIRFLTYYRRPDLIDRLVVAPHLIDESIIRRPVPEKRKKIVAIGRWNEPQKDARLMRAAMVQYLARHPETEVRFIGRDGKAQFGPLTERYPTVICTETIPRSEVAGHLADAQVLILSSLWESFHIAAHEALVLGCTVVGPRVVPLPDIVRQGAFGQMTRTRDPKDLAQALTEEMQLWRLGKRNPAQISRYWRDRLNPHRIVADLVA